MAKHRNYSSDNLDTQESESSYQQYIKRKNFSGSKKGKFFSVAITLICLALIAAVICVVFLRQEEQPDITIKNVSVMGISLQGLTTEEAVKILDQHATKMLPTDEILVKLLDNTLTLTNEDTGAQLDTTAMATAAYLHGRDHKSDGTEPLVLSPYDFVKLDASKIRPLLIDFVQPFNGRPEETTVTVSGERPDLRVEPEENEAGQVLTITIGSPKYLCDPETLFRTIQKAHKNRQLEIVGETMLIMPDPVSAVSIFRQYCVYPTNATLDPDTHIVSESVYGYGFNISQLQLELNKAEYGDIITVPLSRIKPSITTDMLVDSLS